MNVNLSRQFSMAAVASLHAADPVLFALLEAEHIRQAETLALVASASFAAPATLAAGATVAVNVTAEGYPGDRFHAGCEVIDQIERLAIERARLAFGARYANVQPHSASIANELVMFSVMRPGDTLLGMDLAAGGHLTHGARPSVTGRVFNGLSYGLDATGSIDFAQVEELARQHRPRVIVCGATSYPRVIDFKRFRQIADSVGAYLLADITHIAGLVAAGLHPSPIEDAHFVTTCTHKQLYGPRGGLILMGSSADTSAPHGKGTLADAIQHGVFPLMQGAPAPNVIAAKARALADLVTPDFRLVASRIIADARALAKALATLGYLVVSGGTDNHIVLVDVTHQGLTGVIAEKALEQCGIIVNRNKIPGDRRGPRVASGIRLGTNNVAVRRMEPHDMTTCAALIHDVLEGVEPTSDVTYNLQAGMQPSVRDQVRRFCATFPLFFPSTPKGSGPAARPSGVEARSKG